MELTKRADINLGYSCNEKCRFCYYIKSVKAKRRDRDLSTAQAKKTIDFIYGKGIRVLDFTGGEPTIRKDFIELVDYARNKGFEHICLITNGIALSKMDYVKRLVDAGVDDFLISLEGPNADIQDNITGLKGSFELLLKAIKNINELKKTEDIKTRSNTTICGINYDKVPDFLRLLHSLEFKTINFILFNPIVEADASDQELNVEYSKAAPYLMRGIDEYKDKIAKITVRYMPFCLMPGYEKYITNMPQIQYDPDEWDYLVRTRIREGAFVWAGALMIGMLMLFKYGRIFGQDLNVIKHEGIKKFLEFKNKVKGKTCKSCMYYYICDGLWRQYAKWRGFGELKAFHGERVIDPAFFLKEHGHK